MKCNIFLDDSPARVPGTILRAYEIWAEEGDGRWEKGWEETGNYQQMLRIPLNRTLKRLKFIPKHPGGAGRPGCMRWNLFKKASNPFSRPHTSSNPRQAAACCSNSLIKAAAQLRQHIALLLCLNIFCQDAQVKALGHSYNA